jgi:hypothetical protein
MLKFKELFTESKKILLKSITNDKLEVVKIKKPNKKGDWLVVLNDKELNYYFNRNSWWTIPTNGNNSLRVDYEYGKYETKKQLSFEDQKSINKLVGINLI